LAGGSDGEAKEEIRKRYGTHAEYLRQMRETESDTEQWLLEREIKRELESCSTPQELFKRRPELYRQWRKSASIKVGNRIKE
jgi:hypothetical protein